MIRAERIGHLRLSLCFEEINTLQLQLKRKKMLKWVYIGLPRYTAACCGKFQSITLAAGSMRDISICVQIVRPATSLAPIIRRSKKN